MERVVLYPRRGRLVFALALGAAMVLAGHRIWLGIGGTNGEPSLGWIWPLLLVAGGGNMLLRAARALAWPRPSFACDAHGFSIMGRKPHGWDDYRSVSVRALSVGGIPTMRWVRVAFHPHAALRAGHCDIPWSHLPAPAEETSSHIARIARRSRPAHTTGAASYDPYDPAALSLARAKAT